VIGGGELASRAERRRQPRIRAGAFDRRLADGADALVDEVERSVAAAGTPGAFFQLSIATFIAAPLRSSVMSAVARFDARAHR